MLSEQIKFYRKSIGYSQHEMAKLLNISQAGYCYYENGFREPNVETIKKLCVIFDCSADELLEIEAEKKNNKLKTNA